MVKLIGRMVSDSTVAPLQRSAPISSHQKKDDPPVRYNIRDRVTISAKARELSRQSPPPVSDEPTKAILSYELRKPFVFPGAKK